MFPARVRVLGSSNPPRRVPGAELGAGRRRGPGRGEAAFLRSALAGGRWEGLGSRCLPGTGTCSLWAGVQALGLPTPSEITWVKHSDLLRAGKSLGAGRSGGTEKGTESGWPERGWLRGLPEQPAPQRAGPGVPAPHQRYEALSRFDFFAGANPPPPPPGLLPMRGARTRPPPMGRCCLHHPKKGGTEFLFTSHLPAGQAASSPAPAEAVSPGSAERSPPGLDETFPAPVEGTEPAGTGPLCATAGGGVGTQGTSRPAGRRRPRLLPQLRTERRIRLFSTSLSGLPAAGSLQRTGEGGRILSGAWLGAFHAQSK